MKCVVFPLLLLLCTATGCPPPGTTLPSASSLGCDLTGKIPKDATLPPVKTWNGAPVPPPGSVTPARVFLFESPKDPTQYWAVVIDGVAVTARYELPVTSLRDFISPAGPGEATGSGPVSSSPTVKVGGPPRPMHVVVPAPAPPQSESVAYWLTLACFQDVVEARALAAATSPPPS